MSYATAGLIIYYAQPYGMVSVFSMTELDSQRRVKSRLPFGNRNRSVSFKPY